VGHESVDVFRAGREHFALAVEAMRDVHGRTDTDGEALRVSLEDGGTYVFLAVEGGNVIGALNGHAFQRPYRFAPEFLLYELDVREEFRGRGVGRRLVEAFVAAARAARAAEVWVLTNESNEAAVRAYERCGFRRVNNDDVTMRVAP
jgi:ribosomal protein S18 acetylase RimI-like enzyme